ncbi:TetR/AcrR family transcriptional regulator [Prauserella flavalba]|uniref:TetR family transcriptional regulator n=1 Tax=Prauserella flavalba TaxID=1477506 RepID=A0A318LST1_9PSEU|nr:TetR family transcriptional regulator C-terminal domain-containing protein [Prauserella flavalba]PXY35457.1 TetR family transcriptional regulator [Prauserella flavalba]
MPRTVDHAQRRAMIAEGLVRLAAREGLHSVTMRAVAAEAGVSLRLVQYYFETKAALLHATLLHLEEASHARWRERLAALPGPVPARRFVEALLAEALPTDERSRAFHLVWTSYAVLAMTEPDLAAQPFVAGPRRLERQLAATLREAAGELPEGADPAAEAARLLALAHGLGTSVLVGQRTGDSAEAVLRYHVDRLFTRAEPA